MTLHVSVDEGHTSTEYMPVGRPPRQLAAMYYFQNP